MSADPVEQTLDVPAPPEPAEEWKTNTKSGRQFVGARGRSGIIHRQGDETVAEARARDVADLRYKPPQTPSEPPSGEKPPEQDKRPRRKSKRPPMPEGPRKVDLKELEKTLAEALKAPAMPCAAFGDEWAAEHFQNSGPYLARNLVMASEHNPWLRRKLEEAATGQDAAMKVISLVGVSGAVVAYLLPPVVWWLNLPVSDKTRQMFGIPPRKEREPAYAASENGQPQSPEAAASPAGA